MWLLHYARLILFYDQVQVAKIHNKVKSCFSSSLGPKNFEVLVVQEDYRSDC
jgi:hypothetical protein